ncbi:MAG: glycine cleavage system protein H [Thermaerobacter sp.]|nr:glycine cleavage system protein H [Thermaerobacter sp.]
MAEIQGCDVPEHLYYDLTNNVWARPDGAVVWVGMTDPAQTLAGRILFVRPKKPGTRVEKGRSLGSLESGKWAGPLVSPLDGVVLESNARLRDEPALLNIDPYGTAWVVRLEPDPGQSWDHLVTGPEAIRQYREKIQAEKIQCMRCS